jgi:hypothetical protein
VLKFVIPRIIIFCWVMFLMPAMSAMANEAKMITFSNGSGSAIGSSTQVKFTIGQSLIGRTSKGTVSHSVDFGIWEMLSRTYITTGVTDDTPNLKDQLFTNYPNPFNPSTMIRFNLAQETDVRIELYDLLGRKVDTLLWETKPAGHHSFTYQPKRLSSGVYLLLMRAGSYQSSQRITLVK